MKLIYNNFYMNLYKGPKSFETKFPIYGKSMQPKLLFTAIF